jgi:para-nitrobenzyl esterase
MQRFCGTDAGVAALSGRVMASYLNFARHGDPNADGLPDWPKYDASRRQTMLLDDASQVLDAPLDGIRKAWQELAL